MILLREIWWLLFFAESRLSLVAALGFRAPVGTPSLPSSFETLQACYKRCYDASPSVGIAFKTLSFQCWGQGVGCDRALGPELWPCLAGCACNANSGVGSCAAWCDPTAAPGGVQGDIPSPQQVLPSDFRRYSQFGGASYGYSSGNRAEFYVPSTTAGVKALYGTYVYAGRVNVLAKKHSVLDPARHTAQWYAQCLAACSSCSDCAAPPIQCSATPRELRVCWEEFGGLVPAEQHYFPGLVPTYRALAEAQRACEGLAGCAGVSRVESGTFAYQRRVEYQLLGELATLGAGADGVRGPQSSSRAWLANQLFCVDAALAPHAAHCSAFQTCHACTDTGCVGPFCAGQSTYECVWDRASGTCRPNAPAACASQPLCAGNKQQQCPAAPSQGPGAQCSGGPRSCCVAHNTAIAPTAATAFGCDDDCCSRAVCALRPSCCGQPGGRGAGWDGACVQLVLRQSACVACLPEHRNSSRVVLVGESQFKPRVLHAVEGDTVFWLGALDGGLFFRGHNVVQQQRPGKCQAGGRPGFESGLVGGSNFFKRTFAAPGTFHYFTGLGLGQKCLNDKMEGVVMVHARGAPLPRNNPNEHL